MPPEYKNTEKTRKTRIITMNQRNYIFLLLLAIVCFSSCSSYKNVPYLKESEKFTADKPINVIPLENGKYHLLDESSYPKYYSLLNELCDAE